MVLSAVAVDTNCPCTSCHVTHVFRAVDPQYDHQKTNYFYLNSSYTEEVSIGWCSVEAPCACWDSVYHEFGELELELNIKV